MKLRGAEMKFCRKITVSFLPLQQFKRQNLVNIAILLSNYDQPWGLPGFSIPVPLSYLLLEVSPSEIPLPIMHPQMVSNAREKGREKNVGKRKFESMLLHSTKVEIV